MAARDQPSGIKPTVRLAVIRQPIDVPMADEGRISGIDGRAAADENDAARKARQHVSRPVGGMNFDDVPVLEGKVRYGGEGAVTHDEHVPARQLEETLDIGHIFAAAIALPRQTAAEAELTAETDGDDGMDAGDLHDGLLPVPLATQAKYQRFHVAHGRWLFRCAWQKCWDELNHLEAEIKARESRSY
jgi:hypothetical protein